MSRERPFAVSLSNREPPCWQAWFDGAALPNPGRIALGVVLISPDGHRLEKSALAGATGCNNEAELLALCAALELAHGAGARRLEVHGDSDFAVRHVAGLDATAVPRLTSLIERARQWLPRFEAMRLVWIPRHRNGEANRLCRLALGLPDEPAAPRGGRPRRP